MVQKIIGAQRDFSYGEVDVSLKRADDHPARKGGLRQMSNARILNSGAIQVRSGRRAIYPISSSTKRIERFAMKPGSEFDIAFTPGNVTIVDPSTGASVGAFTNQGNGAPLPWVTDDDIYSIVYAFLNLSIYVCFGNGMRTQVITWDGVSSWSIADYNETIAATGQKRGPFYRISPQSVTMLPSATTGNITLNFSSPIVVAGMAGTRMRYCNRQVLLGSAINSSQINATVIESLPPSQTLALGTSVGTFAIGDVVIGDTSGAEGLVTASPTSQSFQLNPFGSLASIGSSVTGGTSGATGVVTSVDTFSGVTIVSLNTSTAFVSGETVSGPWGSNTAVGVSTVSLIVQLIPTGSNNAVFFGTERIVGPSASAAISGTTTSGPQAVAIWDDEVINSFRGFPASCFVDQFRLGFCNFSSLPGAISWSSINNPNDLYVGANPGDAMFELAPRKVQVNYVVPGPEGSEFVFCDRALYYIAISATNPLKPGSVSFQLLSSDGCALVQPRLSQEAILYVNAGQNSVMAVLATGAYTRPFNTKNLTELHSHLFNNILAIAAPSADGTFNERYAYVLNGDKSIAVGKYDADTLQDKSPVIGWGPWSGAATVGWIAAYAADVIFASDYGGVTVGNARGGVCEVLDDTLYLDCGFPVNAGPSSFNIMPGKGPLWFMAGLTVSLMDQGTRSMGTYQVDANGYIVPQFRGGEDLTRLDLIAGQPWTMIAEPFCPDASPGTDVGQRMFKRRAVRFAAYVIHSTGFMMGRLFSGPITPASPALGTLMNYRRFPAWNQGDDPTKPPPQREIAERIRPLGRSFDPRVAVIKDTPGPLLIAELGIEATI
ncbi:hypothetical protein IVB43_23870 [Bradyrhizobium sp. 48]|uniref:hypothetical protein n=1 Tax=Bradyrhizobium sp. 48 TaxID=2782676 RepID=UPI001FF92C8F|nr:hypothetical protein [Bradyrhizobium sp. 48]MCK1445427.1 hypothetical protein [Bradyrhizobium sp. 48]